MQSEKFKIIYEDNDLLVIDKPAGINADDFEKRIHRLDKDTSGILLVAKNNKSLEFFQEQFKKRRVIKKYLALAVGEIKTEEGRIETLIGRSPQNRKKQKVYFPYQPDSAGKRTAITKYKVVERFTQLNNFTKGKISAKQNLTGVKNYTLIEVSPKTGRKHQIRAHLAHLNHPIAGDKIYGFKGQICPKELKRHFLHANRIEITLPDGKIKKFKSDLPNDLKEVLKKLN